MSLRDSPQGQALQKSASNWCLGLYPLLFILSEAHCCLMCTCASGLDYVRKAASGQSSRGSLHTDALTAFLLQVEPLQRIRVRCHAGSLQMGCEMGFLGERLRGNHREVACIAMFRQLSFCKLSLYSASGFAVMPAVCKSAVKWGF